MPSSTARCTFSMTSCDLTLPASHIHGRHPSLPCCRFGTNPYLCSTIHTPGHKFPCILLWTCV